MVRMRAHLFRTHGAWNQDRLERWVIGRHRACIGNVIAVRAPHHAAHAHHFFGTAFGTVHRSCSQVSQLSRPSPRKFSAILNLIQAGIQKHESTDRRLQEVQAQLNNLQSIGFR